VLLTFLEPATATLLIAVAIGLGIEVNPVFFLVALVIVIAGLGEAIISAAFGHRQP
jgi:hypothetical protein